MEATAKALPSGSVSLTASPIWSPVGAKTLTGGSSYFSDAQVDELSRPSIPPPLTVTWARELSAHSDWRNSPDAHKGQRPCPSICQAVAARTGILRA
jgi:hypothetical protein